jgi:hypothetical protein
MGADRGNLNEHTPGSAVLRKSVCIAIELQSNCYSREIQRGR